MIRFIIQFPLIGPSSSTSTTSNHFNIRFSNIINSFSIRRLLMFILVEFAYQGESIVIQHKNFFIFAKYRIYYRFIGEFCLFFSFLPFMKVWSLVNIIMTTDLCRGVSFDAISRTFINLDNIFWSRMNENDKKYRNVIRDDCFLSILNLMYKLRNVKKYKYMIDLVEVR